MAVRCLSVLWVVLALGFPIISFPLGGHAASECDSEFESADSPKGSKNKKKATELSQSETAPVAAEPSQDLAKSESKSKEKSNAQAQKEKQPNATEKTPTPTELDPSQMTQAQLEAAGKALTQKFAQFWASVGTQVYEREFLKEPIFLALIAQEHAIIMGAPGNAKTMFVKLVARNIVEDATGQPSFFSKQMTKETTLMETHGSIDFKELTSTGRVKRFYGEGILGSRIGFLDEIFDVNKNAFRNLLEVLAEGTHSEGGTTYQGQIISTFGSTNKFIADVYKAFGNNDPQALLDRFAFAIFVPSEFLESHSYRTLIQSAGRARGPVSQVTFRDLAVLQNLVQHVEIPDHVADFLAALFYDLKPKFELMEQQSKREVEEKERNGESTLPPYKATKFLSKRTLYKAANILRAIVVKEWLEGGGKRPLAASVEDLAQLELFFTLNGPKDSSVSHFSQRTGIQEEREQLSNILQERRMFREAYEQILNEFNEQLVGYQLVDLGQQVSRFQKLTQVEKDEVTERLAKLYMETLSSKTIEHAQDDANGRMIALAAANDAARDWLIELLGAKQFEASFEAMLQAQKERRAAEAEALARAEEERQKKKEAAEKMKGQFQSYFDDATFEHQTGSWGFEESDFRLIGRSADGKNTFLLYRSRISVAEESGGYGEISLERLPAFTDPSHAFLHQVYQTASMRAGEAGKMVVVLGSRLIWFDRASPEAEFSAKKHGDSVLGFYPNAELNQAVVVDLSSLEVIVYEDLNEGIRSRDTFQFITEPGLNLDSLRQALRNGASVGQYYPDLKKIVFTADFKTAFEMKLDGNQATVRKLPELGGRAWENQGVIGLGKGGRNFQYGVEGQRLVLQEIDVKGLGLPLEVQFEEGQSPGEVYDIEVVRETQLALLATQNLGIVVVDLDSGLVIQTGSTAVKSIQPIGDSGAAFSVYVLDSVRGNYFHAIYSAPYLETYVDEQKRLREEAADDQEKDLDQEQVENNDDTSPSSDAAPRPFGW